VPEADPWRAQDDGCEMPRFDAEAFLGPVRGKSMAVVGDSLARNHAGVDSLGANRGRGAAAVAMERDKAMRDSKEERGGEMRGLIDVARSGGAEKRRAFPMALLLGVPLVGATHLRRGEGRDCSELPQLLSSATATWWSHSATCVRTLSRRRRGPVGEKADDGMGERTGAEDASHHSGKPFLHSLSSGMQTASLGEKICYAQCLGRAIFDFAYDCWSQSKACFRAEVIGDARSEGSYQFILSLCQGLS
jgi:hypothetical protein